MTLQITYKHVIKKHVDFTKKFFFSYAATSIFNFGRGNTNQYTFITLVPDSNLYYNGWTISLEFQSLELRRTFSVTFIFGSVPNKIIICLHVLVDCFWVRIFCFTIIFTILVNCCKSIVFQSNIYPTVYLILILNKY